MIYPKLNRQDQYLLIVDTETNGLSSTNSELLEIGFGLLNIHHRSIAVSGSFVYPFQYNRFNGVNGIRKGINEGLSLGICAKYFENLFLWCASEADWITTFNVSFDRPFLLEKFKKEDRYETLDETIWVCGYNDFKYPKNPKRQSLLSSLRSHGYAGRQKHRALPDVLSYSSLFRLAYPSQKEWIDGLTCAVENSFIGSAQLQAHPTEEYPVATFHDFGFWYDGYKGKSSNRWLKQVFQEDVEQEIKKLPFPVVQVEDAEPTNQSTQVKQLAL